MPRSELGVPVGEAALTHGSQQPVRKLSARERYHAEAAAAAAAATAAALLAPCMAGEVRQSPLVRLTSHHLHLRSLNPGPQPAEQRHWPLAWATGCLAAIGALKKGRSRHIRLTVPHFLNAKKAITKGAVA